MDQPSLPRRLSAADSLMWRIEHDPVLRAPILVVGLLDRSPTADGLTATIERATAVMPRLRQRLQPPPLDLGRPCWEDDESFRIDHHVRRVLLPGGGTGDVLAVAEPDAVAAFDPARPPWTLTVVDGLDEGRAAVVLRFHHTITDGVGSIEIAERIFDRTRRGDRASVVPVEPSDEPAPEAGGRGLDAARLAAAGGDAVALLLAAATHPGRALAGSLRLGRSAARLLAPATGGSPALAGRSLDRRLAVVERPLAELRHAARATGTTINAVLLGAVAGALASYHRAQGRPVPAVRVTMPISIRRAGDHMGGNRFVPTRFVLPVDDPDPETRVRIAGAIVRSWQAEPALGSTDLLAAGLNLLPRPVVARVFGGMLRAVDVDAVDVPGLDRPAFLGGARIERLFGFAPPVGAALSVTLLSHGGTAGIGVACDRAAVTDPELLVSCLEAALGEVVDLGRGRAGPRRAGGRGTAPRSRRRRTPARPAQPAGRPA